MVGRKFSKRRMSSSLSLLRVSVSPVNLISLTIFSVDVSLAGSSAGTERMWQRRRRETQSSLLCFITPLSMCLEGLLRGSWPRAEATGHSDLLTPPRSASKILLTAHLRCFTFLQPSHTQTPRCTCATLNLTHGDTPTLSPHGLLQNSAHSHNPMVRVLAFPDLEHVLPHWDVTSLNTHFLSPCFWFPLWIGWPANNAARQCVRSPALITASCPTANPQPPGEHVHPKLRTRASSYRHLSFKHAHTGGVGENTHKYCTWIYSDGDERTPTQTFQRTPLHLCQLMPTSLVLSWQSQVLENSQSPPACACACEGKRERGNLCMRRPHSTAAELNREHSQLSDVSFSNCCRTGKVETCPYSWYIMTTWAVGSSSWIAPLKSGWVWLCGCIDLGVFGLWGGSAGAESTQRTTSLFLKALVRFRGLELANERLIKWMCYR